MSGERRARRRPEAMGVPVEYGLVDLTVRGPIVVENFYRDAEALLDRIRAGEPVSRAEG